MFTFLKLREEDLPQVLLWRTKPRVTKYQLTDIEEDLPAQRRWFKKLNYDFWVIHHRARPIGTLSLHKDNSWGFYIGEDDAVPLGGLVLPYFYNHAFKTRPSLMAEVMEGNEGIMRLHRFHGFTELGVRSEKVLKYGQRHNMHVFVLSKQSWGFQKGRYGHMLADFEE